MTYAWFRMYSEALDDEKLRLLAFEDRWHFVALLCCKSQGLLDASDDPALRQRKIAVKLGLQTRELEEVARRLSEVGLIDKDTLQPLAWEEMQSNRPSAEVWMRIRKTVFERDDFTCQYCGERGGRLECDHIIPVSRGGNSEFDNLTTACFACNRSKRDKTPEEWLGADYA